MSAPVNITSITDEQLYNGQLALQLACGRSHGAARKKRSQWFCFLFQVLQAEAEKRGTGSPSAPFHAGDLPPFAL